MPFIFSEKQNVEGCLQIDFAEFGVKYILNFLHLIMNLDIKM